MPGPLGGCPGTQLICPASRLPLPEIVPAALLARLPETWSVPPPRTILPLLVRFAAERLPPAILSVAGPEGAPLTVMGPRAETLAPPAIVRLAEPKALEPSVSDDALEVCVNREPAPETRIEPVAVPPTSARSKAPARLTAAPEMTLSVPPLPGKESAAMPR